MCGRSLACIGGETRLCPKSITTRSNGWDDDNIMGLVHFVISTVGRCVDAVSFLLDLNFAVVHTLIRCVAALIAFVHHLPALLVDSAVELGDLTALGLISVAESTSLMAHGVSASCVLALGGLLESLKMVGYLSVHVVLRGKEQLYRGLLSLLECCGIAVSLVLYFTNTVVNFVLIATQNVYSALVGVWHAVSSPLQKVLELTLTLCTFLYSSLVGTSSFLWTPCKLALDFLVSLTHVFVSIFVLNLYGLLLTLSIVGAATLYLNPAVTGRGTRWVAERADSVPGLRRLALTLRRLTSGLQRALRRVPGVVRRLQRVLRRLQLLERRLWYWLSRPRLPLRLALRTQQQQPLPRNERNNNNNNNRVGGDGDPGGAEERRDPGGGGGEERRRDPGGEEERRDPPDGRAEAGDGGPHHHHRELIRELFPSSSTVRPLKKLAPSSSSSGPPPADGLLSLLKEQEERKKCVICQDCTKTVVLLPCRHLCLCRGCTDILLRQPVYQHNCPLCRHMIISTMDVYL